MHFPVLHSFIGVQYLAKGHIIINTSNAQRYRMATLTTEPCSPPRGGRFFKFNEHFCGVENISPENINSVSDIQSCPVADHTDHCF